MQLVQRARITFPAIRNRAGIVIKLPTAVHIESTFKQLTSHAEITIARNVKYFDKRKVRDVFRPGDPVTVELGYDDTLIEEFRGYVAHVSADIPIVIRCEDEMYKVKRIAVNYSAPTTTLDKMLKSICPGYAVDALENVKLGSVRFAKTTVSKVLEKLQQEFGLYSYMRGSTLVCGKYYSTNTGIAPIKFNIEKNVVSNGLNYRNKEDVIIRIKGSSIMLNGKKLEVEYGEDGGDRLELTYFNIQLKAELERLVKLDYEKKKQAGFDGSMTVFGAPTVRHGLKVDITSRLYPDRNGIYYVEGVTKDWGEDGYRQIIKLGDKAA